MTHHAVTLKDPRPARENDLHRFTVQLLKLCGLTEMDVLPEYMDDVRKLLSSVRVTPSGCWEWTKSRKSGGYPQFVRTNGKKNAGGHRIMMMAFGHNLDGMCACHHCDNPPCIRPDHLFVGSHQDNHEDCKKKGRHVPPPVMDWPAVMRVQRHHWQRLSLDDIAPIRARLKSGHTLAAIAADFGVSFQTISKIKLGTRWGHVK